jgi:hypothetical protein
MSKRKSAAQSLQDATIAGGEEVARILNNVGEGKTVVVAVVTPVIITGTIILNRELEWEGGDIETETP